MPVHQESQTSQHAAIFGRSSAKRNSHAIGGTDKNARPTNLKSGCTWRETCVFKRTGKVGKDTNGNAAIATNLEETKRTALCMDRRPSRYVLSKIHSEEDRMATNRETFQCAMLSQCRKTLPYKRRKRSFIGYCSEVIQKRSQSERPYL